MHSEALQWIERLQLEPHPEGGFYRVTYQSEVWIPQSGLPTEFAAARRVATSIYYLLSDDDFSALHRLRADELWHFHAGSDLVVHVIDPAGERSDIRIGEGNFQAVVKAGNWFGTRLVQQDSFALVGCTVAPGFDFADFEIARREELSRQFPQHRDLITALTRL